MLNITTNNGKLWQNLFYQMNPEITLRIQATRGKDTLTLSYTKDDSFIPGSNIETPKRIGVKSQSSASSCAITLK